MPITIAEITTFLESHHPFAMLPSAMLKDLAHKCELHANDTGEVVYTAGDEAMSLYLIYSGLVVLNNGASVSGGSKGIGRELTQLQGGDFFGGRVLLEGSRQLDTVRSLQPTLILVCDRDVVSMLVRNYRPLLDRIRLHNRSLPTFYARVVDKRVYDRKSRSLCCAFRTGPA